MLFSISCTCKKFDQSEQKAPSGSIFPDETTSGLLKPANVLFVDSPTLEHKYRFPENISLFLPGSIYLHYTLGYSNKVGYKGILGIIFPLLSIKTIINRLQENIFSEFMTVTYYSMACWVNSFMFLRMLASN